MIITRTPLRISLAGGGSDIPPYADNPGGMVVSLAIDKYIYVMVNGRFSQDYRISYTKTEIVDHVDKIKHGIIREAIKMYSPGFIEVVTMADIPGTGSGLGSSGAVAVGSLLAIDAYLNGITAIYKGNIADLATLIEMRKLKKPCGYQDQYACAVGGINLLHFFAGETSVKPLPNGHDIAKHLMTFFTGKTRSSSNILVNHKASDPGYKNSQRTLAMKMADFIKLGYIEKIGPLMSEGWELKRKVSGVTNPKIDEMYQKGMKGGATGGKVSGAGGGGFMTFFVPLDKQTAVRQAMRGYKELFYNLDEAGVIVARMRADML